LNKKWTNELQNLVISDSKPLLEGRIRIEEEVKKKIDAYLASKYLRKLGVFVRVIVVTKTGRLIYPSLSQLSPNISGSDTSPPETHGTTPEDMLRIAMDNWKIMQEGIKLVLSVSIPKESFLANMMLAFFILVFIGLVSRAYRKASREEQLIETQNRRALETANKKLMSVQERLRDVGIREKNYQKEIKKLKEDLDQVSDRVQETENEALSEMERLEKNLNESLALKEELELEVLRLGEELEKIESEQKIPPRKQRKQIDSAAKRFKTLYKNLVIQQRAIEGYLDLQSDMQLRAEELIHTMNEDNSKLPVKRKLFSKKGATPTFECEFGYRGRIYWRPGPGTKTEILAIGTKNSQTKDLAYLEIL